MRKKIHKILVTGGAGFIGSAFVRQVVSRGCGSGISVIIVDNLTYAGDIKRLAAAKGKYKFYKTDISDKPGIQSIFKREKPDTVVHFAAETHVDRSILDPTFILSSLTGKLSILFTTSFTASLNFRGSVISTFPVPLTAIAFSFLTPMTHPA